MRHQRSVIFLGLGAGDFFKQEPQVLTGLKSAGFGGFDQAVKSCSGMSTVGMPGKQEIFPSDDKWPDGVFRQVIMGRDVAVFQITDEPGPFA